MSGKSKKAKDEDEKPIVIKSTYDLQRLKLEKLMKNPDKLAFIPESPKERSMSSTPDFVRNVMGSSAGAGSGEFHVYRHLRRKEYARQKFIQEKSEKERLDDEYHTKLEQNKKIAEEKTAKKRAKRLKKIAKIKKKKVRVDENTVENKSDSEEEANSSIDDTHNERTNCDRKNAES